jgi:hypothetical protein
MGKSSLWPQYDLSPQVQGPDKSFDEDEPPAPNEVETDDMNPTENDDKLD